MTLKQIPLQGGKGPTGDPGPAGPAGKGWGWTYKSGQWYGPSGMRDSAGLVSADMIYASYILIGSTRTFDRIAYDIGQQSGGNVKLGIYADDGQGYPGLKLLETANIPNNLPSRYEATINQTLQQGLYWLTYFASNICDVAAWEIQNGSACLGVPGLPTHATGGAGCIGAYQLSRTFSLGYPSSFPTGAPPRIGVLPRVILRAA